MTDSQINKSVKKPIKMDKRAKAQEGLLDSLAEFDASDDWGCPVCGQDPCNTDDYDSMEDVDVEL